MLASNVQVCRAGLLLCVLPDVAAAEGVAAGELRRLAWPELPPIEVFAARAAAGRLARADAVVAAAADRLASLDLGGRRRAGRAQRASVRS